MTSSEETTSTRPYLIRALHEWCCDNNLTPYLTVAVDNSVQVPREYVNDGEIVLNVGLNATTSLHLGNDYIEFKARFSGVVRDIMIPVNQVLAIFARENGQGMAFPKVDRRVEMGIPKSSGGYLQAPDEAGALTAAETPGVARLASVQAGADTESAGSPMKPKQIKKKDIRPTLTRIK